MIQTYTLADFRTETQFILNEPLAGALWSDAELNGYINVAILRVAIDTHSTKKETVVTLGKNVGMYFLPQDSLRPEFIYSDSQWGFERLYPTNLMQLDQTGQGDNKWETNLPSRGANFVPFSHDQFIVWPVPSVTVQATLHYVPYPTTLVSDTDTTTFAVSAARLVPIFTAYLAMMKENVEKAAGYLADYNTRIAPVQAQERNNSKSRPAIMAPARHFDRRNANPEVGRFTGIRGYR